MKKNLFLSFILLGCLGCVDEFEASTAQEQDQLVTKFERPQSRSLEGAIAIAIDAASSIKSSSSSRSKSIGIDNVVSIMNPSCSRSGFDTLMYVVNYEDNNGYAIIFGQYLL